MRCITHPGPVHPERIECVCALVAAHQIVLPVGTVLRDGLVEAVKVLGAEHAVLSVRHGSCDPLDFVIPSVLDQAGQVLWYSETHRVPGDAVFEGACITLGTRDGEPMLHCHAAWRDVSGTLGCGHLLPHACIVRQDLHLDAWLLDGACFDVLEDAETHFHLFHARAATRAGSSVAAAGTASQDMPGKTPALVLRLRANQDICLTLEQLCVQHGIRRAHIRGGVGSLIGATFTDGRRIEPFATETFIHAGGQIAPGADGTPQCTITVTSVDFTGGVNSGTLMRGHNPVLITFELVLDIQETMERT